MNEENAMTVQTIKAHISLNVRNIWQGVEFYKKMLGIEPSKVRSGYAKAEESSVSGIGSDYRSWKDQAGQRYEAHGGGPTGMVFLAPFTQRLLRRMMSPLSRTLSLKASPMISRTTDWGQRV